MHPGRRRTCQLPRNAELFLKTIQHYRAAGEYKLHDFVVMPDHVQLLLTPTGKSKTPGPGGRLSPELKFLF